MELTMKDVEKFILERCELCEQYYEDPVLNMETLQPLKIKREHYDNQQWHSMVFEAWSYLDQRARFEEWIKKHG